MIVEIKKINIHGKIRKQLLVSLYFLVGFLAEGYLN